MVRTKKLHMLSEKEEKVIRLNKREGCKMEKKRKGGFIELDLSRCDYNFLASHFVDSLL